MIKKNDKKPPAWDPQPHKTEGEGNFGGGVACTLKGGGPRTSALQRVTWPYANEPAVREEGCARRLCGLKMAEGETSLGMAFAGASDTREPVAKRPKISPPTDRGSPAAEAERGRPPAGAAEGWEAAEERASPAGEEAEPAMAVEQEKAPAEPGGDNNGLGMLVPDPHQPVLRQGDTAVLGTREESAGML